MPLANPELTEFTTASQKIVSYDYVDIANGLGFQNFYLFQSEDTASGVGYGLTTDTSLKAMPNRLLGTSTEFNFDSSVFNETRTVKGTAYANLVGGTNNSSQSSINLILYKVTVADAEVALSSSFGMTHAKNGPITYLIQMPLTETLIKKGEKLRLSLTTVDNSPGATGIGTDPSSQGFSIDASEGYSSDSKIAVPFKIEN